MSTNQDKSKKVFDVDDNVNVGMPSKSFYGNYSAKSNSRKFRALKRKLDDACENVKMKRTRDLFMSEQNSVKNILSDPIPLVYRVFNKQSDALDFAQHWDSFRVFANEHNDKGHRHFLSCHPQTFWRLLKAKSPNTRYAYEVIGEIFPSKLYFDLEYKTAQNPHINGQDILTKFKNFIKKDLRTTTCMESVKLDHIEILDMDSSTNEKFSHHLIVNMYDMNKIPLLFVNNLHVGLYVRELIDRLISEKEETFPRLSDQKVFVDEAVYTKNRNFRTFLSSKYGKNVVLKKATEALPKYEDEEFFHKSLVTFVDQTPILVKMERKKLIKFNIGTMSYQKVDPNAPTPSSSAKSATSVRKTSNASKSAFPEIDNYVQDLVKKQNENGYIRKVDTSPCGFYLTYEFSHYKFCQNIGRQHKSNNVMLFVDLKSNKVGQMCHDPDCKDFRSELWNLPENCAIPWQEMFGDDNENEEKKKDSIPDDDMDRLLLEVDDEPLDEIDSLLLSINEEQLAKEPNAENNDENVFEDEDDDFFREICNDLP